MDAQIIAHPEVVPREKKRREETTRDDMAIALMVKCRNALRKLDDPVRDPEQWSMVADFISALEGELWVAARLLRGCMRDPRNDVAECKRLAEKIEKLDGLAAKFENWDNLDEPVSRGLHIVGPGKS
ncbi:MAG: hypothetical protein WAN65_23625 [Candidatus Sulfotelmatobacter sp.]